MAKGRPPKPVSVRRQEGLRSRRPAPDEVAIGGKHAAPTPPPMTSAALVVWEEIAPMLHTSGVLDRVDARMLAMFCEATAQAELARQMMEAARNSTGLVVQQPSGRVAPDPHFTVWKDAVAAARQLAEQFGLTPSARARLGIGAQTQAQIAQIDEHVGQSPRLRAVDGGSAAE